MRRHRAAILAVAAAIVVALTASPAPAWLRMRYEDQEVVGRSELIVVGRLDAESIRYVAHERKPHQGRSWEHHAMLIVDEVVKGTSSANALPIIIHYGLTPVVGQRWEHDGNMVTQPGNPPGAVAILDTGNSAMSFTPLVPNAAKNHIWYLRKIKDLSGGGDGRRYGIEDPEDLQPIELRAYLQCYLAADPESAVREQIQKQPEVAQRATRYLVHCEVARIAKLPDPRQRVERALPYWLANCDWGHRLEAMELLLDAGEVAGPYLVGVFETRPDRRAQVLSLWGQMSYRACVPRLIKLLEQHDEFWRHQTLEGDWWNHDPDAQRQERRREVYGETYAALVALDRIDDPSARDVIERTRARWAAIDFSNPQIVQTCEKTLRRWDAAPKGKS